MNVWTVPSTPDNNPAMSHLGMIAQFTLPILSIVSYVGIRRTDWSIDKWMEPCRGNRCNCYTRCMLLSNKRRICFVSRIDTVLLQHNYHFPILWQRKNSGYSLKRIFRRFVESLVLLHSFTACYVIFQRDLVLVIFEKTRVW